MKTNMKVSLIQAYLTNFSINLKQKQLWYVLTGGTVFGMDVIANLTALITGLGNGGFVGLIVLVLIASFFTKK